MKRLMMSGLILLASVAVLIAGGAPRREDVPKYVEMLKTSKSASDRALAADMLGKRGAVNVKDVADAIEPLRMALKKDSELQVKRAAAKALGMIVPEPAEDTVPLLIGTLKDMDHALRMATVQALGAYGPEAQDALPTLRAMQKQADKKDKKSLADAITSISQKKKKK